MSATSRTRSQTQAHRYATALAIILGLFFAGLINFTVAHTAGSTDATVVFGFKAWQAMFGCLLVPAAFYIVLTALIPESPRYLVSARRRDEAARVLTKVTGERDVAARIDAIERSLGAEARTLSIGQILRSKWRGLVFVGMAIAAFQQLTGTNGIFFYSNTLFEAVGFDESTAFVQTLILTFFKIIGVGSGILLVDKVGRKRMLICGGTLIFCSLAAVARCHWRREPTSSSTSSSSSSSRSSLPTRPPRRTGPTVHSASSPSCSRRNISTKPRVNS